MAIFFIERAILIFANAIIEPFFSRSEQKNALSGYFYKRHPVDYKIFIFLGQPLGYLEGVTHGYIRHGKLTLFAALEVASGRVISRRTLRHRHQAFFRFLQTIKENVPVDLDGLEKHLKPLDINELS